jgi:predicted metal-dependent hydrolase
MAKKKFKLGLGDLLDNAMDNNSSKVESNKRASNAAKRTSSKKPSKSFSDNLDDLFQEAIEESLQENADKIKKKNRTTSKRKKPMFGLDALIRETVESSSVEVTPSNTKRVTFVFDEEKINKLKQIARLKKAYVKDIVDEIISEYLKEHNIID